MRPLASALWLMIFAALAADADAMAQEAASRPLPLGIVDAKPARGRFVDLGDGTWMVPYRETIADGLSFQMVPIEAESPRSVLPRTSREEETMKDPRSKSRSHHTGSGRWKCRGMSIPCTKPHTGSLGNKQGVASQTIRPSRSRRLMLSQLRHSCMNRISHVSSEETLIRPSR